MSKLEQKAKGYPSPDRADSLNLCYWDYDYVLTDTDDSISIEEDKIDEKESHKQVQGDFDMRVWAKGKQSIYTPDHVEQDDMEELREQIAMVNKQRKHLTCK